MRTLQHLAQAHLAARPDCAAYLPAFEGKEEAVSATSPLKRADSGGLEAGIADLIAAASVYVAIPTLVVYLALQRHFIAGLTLGSTKG